MFQIPHNPWLVALSIAIAIQGSFVGLSLASELDTAGGVRRKLALAGSALTLATGVWAMHFVGMLAASFPSAVDYLAFPTLLSFLICVLVVGCGVYFAHAPNAPRLRIVLGAVGMGLGVCTMHYVGVSAVHLAGPVHQEAPYVAASFLVSVAASGSALWALTARPGRSGLFLGAVALGLAISGMHYTAMAGMRLDPTCFEAGRFVEASGAMSRNTLALLATVIAFGVSGAFLLSLVPEASAFAAGPTLALAPAVAFDAPATLPSMAAPRPEAPPPLDASGRKGRLAPGNSLRACSRRSSQRALHLRPRRGAGIFLQPGHQHARGSTRPREVYARAPQPSRSAVGGEPHQAAGRSRRARANNSSAVQHSRGARAVPRTQAPARIGVTARLS